MLTREIVFVLGWNIWAIAGLGSQIRVFSFEPDSKLTPKIFS
jgi:hypothetical protein